MAKSKLTIRLLALILFAVCPPVFAASVSLISSAFSVAPNGTFMVNLDLDATTVMDPNYSGSVIIDYDPARLTFTGFQETVNGTTSDLVSNTLAGTVFLNFGDISSDTATIGKYGFQATLLQGVASIGVADGDSLGSFLANQNEFFPTFNGTSVTVEGAPVPLPGALWLMMSGLGMLGLARRKAG